MKKIFTLIVLLTLTACTGTPKAPDFICPDVGFMRETPSIVLFHPDIADPKLQDIGLKATFYNLAGACRLTKNNRMIVDILARINLERFAAPQPVIQNSLSYFIALLDKNDAILQREKFSVDLPAADKKTTPLFVEHRIRIPESFRDTAGTLRIVIGFIATEKQIALQKKGT